MSGGEIAARLDMVSESSYTLAIADEIDRQFMFGGGVMATEENTDRLCGASSVGHHQTGIDPPSRRPLREGSRTWLSALSGRVVGVEASASTGVWRRVGIGLVDDGGTTLASSSIASVRFLQPSFGGVVD